MRPIPMDFRSCSAAGALRSARLLGGLGSLARFFRTAAPFDVERSIDSSTKPSDSAASIGVSTDFVPCPALPAVPVLSDRGVSISGLRAPARLGGRADSGLDLSAAYAAAPTAAREGSRGEGT